MQIIIETERLCLREFTLDDAALIYQLNTDPEVTRYTLDSMNNIDQARQVLEQVILPQYALYQHGRWAVLVKPGMAFIGWCGLKAVPERKEIDLGYRFMPAVWGKGYATESAFACLRYGFEKLHLPRIIGRAMPGNLASLRVLEKCGMHNTGEGIVDGHPAISFEALNPNIL